MKTGILSLAFGLIAMAMVGCAEPQQAKGKSEMPEEVVTSGSQEMPKMGMQVLSETVAVGKVAPDFELPDENGKKWKLSDYKGKVVLLDFWGFWCSYCVKELPELREINDELSKEDFVMIGINTDTEEAAEVRKLLKEAGVNWRQGMMPEPTKMADDYQVSGFPTKVMIDKEGKIVYIDNFILKEDIQKYL